MKVDAVSFSFSGKHVKNKQEINLPYLYTVDLAKKQPTRKKDNGIKIATGFLALSAVLITLFNIKGPKRPPLNITDIADKTKGLNKIKGHEKNVNELKKKVLYPLLCAIKGDKQIAYTKHFKSGVILTDKNGTNLSNITEAFIEHAKELGIRTVSIPHTGKRTNSKGKVFEHRLKRNELIKNVYSELKRAKELFQRDGKYTIINLGDIAKLTDLKVIKSQKSNFEAMLANLDNRKFPGVIWAGWTTKTKDVPLFFNDLPILITKLVD